MDLIADLIERKIEEAIGRGEFKNLPGEGKPIELDEDTSIPFEYRMAVRVLKNSGFVPPEVIAYNEIRDLRSQVNENKDLSPSELQNLKLRLVEKETALNLSIERMMRVRK